MSKKSVNEMVEKLSNVVLGDDFIDVEFNYSFHPTMLDFIVQNMAEIEPRNLTFSELLNKMDDNLVNDYDNDPYYASNNDLQTLRIVEALYPHWYDKQGLIEREDNVLNWQLDPDDWRIGYKMSLAELISSKGSPIALSASYYSWVDYDLLAYSDFDKPVRDKAVAVFNIREDYWSEFNGTFNTDDDSHSGMVADVLYSTGLFRKVRYEGNLREIMNDMMS